MKSCREEGRGEAVKGDSFYTFANTSRAQVLQLKGTRNGSATRRSPVVAKKNDANEIAVSRCARTAHLMLSKKGKGVFVRSMPGAVFHAVVLVILACASSACTPRPQNWVEEVEISGGQIIRVERQERYRSNQEFGGIKNVWVESSKIEIVSANLAPTPPPLITQEFLLRFDFDSALRQWYAVTLVEDCYRARELGLGERPYFEYRSDGGSWTRRPVGRELIGTEANLLISKSIAQSGDVVLLDVKRRADASISLPNYLKRILDRVPC